MTSQINMNDIQTKILSELAAIRDMLSPPSKKEKKPRKTNAAPNNWILFTGRVREILKTNQFAAGKEAQQFASHLKSLSENAYSMADEEILAARKTWTAPEKKEKEEKVKEVKEEKKEVKEEKKEVKEEKKEVKEEGKKEQKVVATKKVAKALPVADIEETVKPPPSQNLRPFPLKGKKYVWDPESNGLWLPGPNNTKGSWVGVLSSDRKTIDTTVSNPESTA